MGGVLGVVGFKSVQDPGHVFFRLQGVGFFATRQALAYTARTTSKDEDHPKGSMYPYSIYLGLKGVPMQ